MSSILLHDKVNCYLCEFDRGTDTIKLYKWMEQLREEALHAGGTMFSHLGNHEFMNVLGEVSLISLNVPTLTHALQATGGRFVHAYVVFPIIFSLITVRYVLQSDIATFGSVEKRQAALTTGFIGSAWAQNYTVASRVPLHPFSGAPFSDYSPSSSPNPLSHASLSFMHGGLSPAFAEVHGSPYPSTINALGASLLHRCRKRSPLPPPHPPAPYAGLPPGSTPAEHFLYSSDGPLWYRGWAMDDTHAVCNRVGKIMEKIGVRRLIMGHTPDFEVCVMISFVFDLSHAICLNLCCSKLCLAAGVGSLS